MMQIFFSDNMQKDFVVIDLLHGFFPSLPHENTQEDLHLSGAYFFLMKRVRCILGLCHNVVLMF